MRADHSKASPMLLLPITAGLGQGVSLAFIQHFCSEIVTNFVKSGATNPSEIAKLVMNRNGAILAASLGSFIAFEVIKTLSSGYLHDVFRKRYISKVEEARISGTKSKAFIDHQILTGKTADYAAAIKDAIAQSAYHYKTITSLGSTLAFLLACGSMNKNLAASLKYEALATLTLSLISFSVAGINAITSIYLNRSLQERGKAYESFSSLSQSVYSDPMKAEQTSVNKTFGESCEEGRNSLLDAENKVLKQSFGRNAASASNKFINLFFDLAKTVYAVNTGLYPSLVGAFTSFIIKHAFENFLFDFEEYGANLADELSGAKKETFADYTNYINAAKPTSNLTNTYVYDNQLQPEIIVQVNNDFASVVPNKDGSTKVISRAKKGVTFEAGYTYHFSGDSGLGKSTFTYALGNLTNIWNGTIHANTCLQNANSVQYVSQSGMTNLPGVSLFKLLTSNIESPDEACRTKLNELLKSFDLFENFGGDKLDSPINRPSGGEQARLLMVKALLQNSKLIVLDESFNSVQSDKRDQYRDIVKQYAKINRAAVIILDHSEKGNGKPKWADKVVKFEKQMDGITLIRLED